MVVAFEAEMNVVMYADEGDVTLAITDEDITIEVDDRGPGIPDLELAMQEGWSTATDEMREMGFGFGMGLPNIRSNSDSFDLHSEVNSGTVVVEPHQTGRRWLSSRTASASTRHAATAASPACGSARPQRSA